ncbi:Glycoside hydrolase, family 28 [Cynara cardunculus var. scolymus]|uniref:Glycoside hydrolase, family 28 n=1 Tax=Cynara cardunculus var. scolymus TaxID=59895 RepID=A0A103XYV0_CYNCS|nr:Glycoside hydrolase, family 28 [Cynara cardunculus var. scolymus]
MSMGSHMVVIAMIRRVTEFSPFVGIAVESETYFGVYNVFSKHITLNHVGVGIHLKTNIGRGEIIRNITISNVYMVNVHKGIKIAGDVVDHPNENYNRNALPVIKHVRITNVWGKKVQKADLIIGLKNSPFTNICLSNINLRNEKFNRFK